MAPPVPERRFSFSRFYSIATLLCLKKNSSKGLVFKRTNSKNNCLRTPPKPSKTMDSLDREDQKKSLIELNNRSSENLNIDFSEENLKIQVGELCREGEEAARGCGRDRQHSSHFWDVSIHFPNSCFSLSSPRRWCWWPFSQYFSKGKDFARLLNFRVI